MLEASRLLVCVICEIDLLGLLQFGKREIFLPNQTSSKRRPSLQWVSGYRSQLQKLSAQSTFGPRWEKVNVCIHTIGAGVPSELSLLCMQEASSHLFCVIFEIDIWLRSP